mmetsp:Transcript_46664/g.68224  ORF Transcript_46664/g.68224 Transcript_46664/m.68224 type:complete len:197 (+) Transcript_46664:26-616(+)
MTQRLFLVALVALSALLAVYGFSSVGKLAVTSQPAAVSSSVFPMSRKQKTALKMMSDDESGAADALYLEQNAKKPGVIVLPSGLQYRVLREGEPGAPSPSKSQKCSCHYEGRNIRGQVFDSSYQRGEPIDFAPNQVIKGWTEAMQLMKEGDKWELTVPSELAYGRTRMGRAIYPGATLIFEMEILKVYEKPAWQFW